MLCIRYFLYKVRGSPSVSLIDQISESFVSTILSGGNNLIVPPLQKFDKSSYIDMFASISVSGPAYSVFLLMEAMIDAGVHILLLEWDGDEFGPSDALGFDTVCNGVEGASYYF